jgi:hypothetical protein
MDGAGGKLWLALAMFVTGGQVLLDCGIDRMSGDKEVMFVKDVAPMRIPVRCADGKSGFDEYWVGSGLYSSWQWRNQGSHARCTTYLEWILRWWWLCLPCNLQVVISALPPP